MLWQGRMGWAKAEQVGSPSYLSASFPISVVHTGVKSAGWENRMAHDPSIHSYQWILPCMRQ